MKLSEWADRHNIRYKAALRMFHDGTLPVPAMQMPNKTILVLPPSYSFALETIRRLPREDQVRLAREVLERDS
jgi:predicted site-specific integrase-resolvase